MASNFDLGLIIRAQESGVTQAGARLAKTLQDVATAEQRAAAQAEILRERTARTEGAQKAAELAAVKLALAQERLAAAQRRTVQSSQGVVQSAGAVRAGTLQLGQQIQDVGIQLSSGTDFLRVFAQQAGQTAFAVQQMGGVGSRVAAFIGGPFGSLILAGVSVLATLAFTSDKAKESAKELGDGMNFAGLSANDLTKAIGELEAAQRKQIRTSFESEQAAYADAAAALAAARAKREQAKATLQAAIASAQGNAGQGTGGAAGAFTGGAADVARAQLAEIDASIGSAEALERLAKIPVIQREIRAATDASARATLEYDRALASLTARFNGKDAQGKAVAKNLLISESQYRAELTRITRLRDAAIDAARQAERQTKAKGPALPSVTPNEVGAIFGLKPGQFGGTRTPERNRQVRGARNSDHLTGNAVDLPLTIAGKPLTRAGITAALSDAGIKVRKLLGPGDKDHDDHFHVSFEKTRQSADQVANAAERAAERLKREADALVEFGERAANAIAGINGRFDEQPTLIDQGAKAVRDLDALIADLEKRKPPNFEKLVTDAKAAKAVVADGIQRPYADFIESQRQGLQVQRLILQGRQDEAEAIQQIVALEKTMGPLKEGQKEAILAGVQAARALGRETDLLRAKQQRYLSALGDIKSAIGDVLRDPLKGLADLPKRLIDSFASLKADELFENLFGDTFRAIEDKITGANVAKDAAQQFADAVDRAAASVAKLGDVAEAAASGQPVGGDLGTATVTGQRSSRLGSSPFGLFSGSIERVARKLGIGDSQVKRDADVADALKKGVSIKDDAAAKIGKSAGKALDGAATGAMVNSVLKPLGKALGFKTSAAGAQIGGAVGSFLPIPFGKEIGAVVGSVVGGLFKRTKSGSTTITNAFDKGTTKGDFKGVTSALGASIQGSILSIAESLGGGLGSFNISIGKRKDKFRVDPTGRGRTKGVFKTESENEAIAYAIRQAILQGAVTGLSDAVRKAIQSSDDIDAALREALKVQDLEALIGGVGGRLLLTFRRYDAEAAERVRLAKKYGLDLAAVEKINAEERVKLVENILQSRVGSLIAFQKNMQFGDLFEGDAQTRRSRLLDEIATVQQQAEAGVDGAADKLADLYRSLIETSKEAFGTAGPELAADRALAQSGVDKVLAMENARIAEAKAYQDAALAAANQNNALTNETNNLLAQLVAQNGGGGAIVTIAAALKRRMVSEAAGGYGERYTQLN